MRLMKTEAYLSGENNNIYSFMDRCGIMSSVLKSAMMKEKKRNEHKKIRLRINETSAVGC